MSVERAAQPQGLLVGNLRGTGEAAAGHDGGVTDGEDVIHCGGRGRAAAAVVISGSAVVGAVVSGSIGGAGLQLDAEVVVDKDQTGFGVALDEPLVLVWVFDLGTRVGVEDGGRGGGEGSDGVEGFGDKGVLYVLVETLDGEVRLGTGLWSVADEA